MSYIEDSLSRDENIECIFKMHWTFQWLKPFSFSIFFSLPFLIVSIVCVINAPLLLTGLFLLLIGLIVILATFLYVWFYYKKMEIGVTNKRVIYKKGIVARNTQEVNLDAIETIEIRQGVIARIFNSGLVRITGRGGSDLTLQGVDNPMDVKRKIESLLPSINQRFNPTNNPNQGTP